MAKLYSAPILFHIFETCFCEVSFNIILPSTCTIHNHFLTIFLKLTIFCCRQRLEISNISKKKKFDVYNQSLHGTNRNHWTNSDEILHLRFFFKKKICGEISSFIKM